MRANSDFMLLFYVIFVLSFTIDLYKIHIWFIIVVASVWV